MSASKICRLAITIGHYIVPIKGRNIISTKWTSFIGLFVFNTQCTKLVASLTYY